VQQTPFKAPFWALPGLFLSRATAAVSIAAINSVGNLGGFVGPYVLGLVKGWTGSQGAGLLMLSALLLISFLMTYFVRLTGGTTAEAPAGAARA
jgi:MFS transporter, ACS family, tartrate transporter